MFPLGQERMHSPHPMHSAGSTINAPPSPEVEIAFVGQTAWQTPQKEQAGVSRRGSIHPLIPASFSSAFMQLLTHPETPILNLCGTGFP
jgi:hypothetical protein